MNLRSHCHAHSLLGLALALSLSACGASSEGETATDAATDGLESLEISPQDAELVVRNGVEASQPYTVMATYTSGETADVTADANLSVLNVQLGGFASGTFTTSGFAGGRSTVRASLGDTSIDTGLTVLLKTERIDEGAASNAAELFDAATDDASLAPTLVYPQAGTLFPPNLGDFEAHWTSTAATDLYEVSLTSEFASVRLFTAKDATTGAFSQFTLEEWNGVGQSSRGREVAVAVRALNTASPEVAGSTGPQVNRLTNTDIEGGIYYWASSGALPGGVYRHDMSRPGESAEPFYTTGESPSGRCVACHVLSREGDKMAITYDGGNGSASIVDVATRQALLPTDGTFAWNFATFEPTGDRIVTVSSGALTLRDVETGAPVNEVPTDGYATHVDFSPVGDRIVYSQVATPGQDWHFSNGSIVVQSFDAGSAMWGAPTTLYAPAAGSNAFYPSFSPDGEWVLFNVSQEDAYDDRSAELYVMKSDGSTEPFRLDSPNVSAELTNSWARWAPFAQQLEVDGAAPEPFYWLTFSSKRAFGVRLTQGITPQLWMTPFFPGRVGGDSDPSAPAFRLPFQELGTNNHIAQWTTRVVAPVD